VPASTHCTSACHPSAPRLSVRNQFQLFVLSALALVVSFGGQVVLGAVLTALPLSVVASAIRTSARQDLAVLLWAALSAVVFLAAAGRHAWMRRSRLAALMGGAISPWALLGLAQLEGHFWPSFRQTNGPLDRPLMTQPLLICALLIPWLSGRAARAHGRRL
jgi:hypothetical protein